MAETPLEKLKAIPEAYRDGWELAHLFPEILALWEVSDPHNYLTEGEWENAIRTARLALNARAAELMGGE
jgi:hypothetical protein